jgi:hypothetical protein
MSFTIYDAAIPPCIHTLSRLSAILEKGAADAEARKIDPTVFLTARLAPDMFALARQVQVVSDTAKGCARLAGVEVPAYADTETSFAELQERIKKTVSFLQSLDASAFDGAETRTITLKMRTGDIHMSGHDYVTKFVLPNLYFHAVTAYDILRHNGVAVGKMDFLGGA